MQPNAPRPSPCTNSGATWIVVTIISPAGAPSTMGVLHACSVVRAGAMGMPSVRCAVHPVSVMAASAPSAARAAGLLAQRNGREDCIRSGATSSRRGYCGVCASLTGFISMETSQQEVLSGKTIFSRFCSALRRPRRSYFLLSILNMAANVPSSYSAAYFFRTDAFRKKSEPHNRNNAPPMPNRLFKDADSAMCDDPRPI